MHSASKIFAGTLEELVGVGPRADPLDEEIPANRLNLEQFLNLTPDPSQLQNSQFSNEGTFDDAARPEFDDQEYPMVPPEFDSVSGFSGSGGAERPPTPVEVPFFNGVDSNQPGLCGMSNFYVSIKNHG